jgi:hypothetical protein
MMKSFLALTCVAVLSADSIAAHSVASGTRLQAAKPEEIRAVMFFVTVDKRTGVWTHAQVIGGYKDHDDCTRAVSIIRAAAASNLAATDVPIFLCPTIDSANTGAQQNSDGKTRPGTPQPRDDIGLPSSSYNL